MPYRIERLPLTTVRSGSRTSTLARLSRRRTRLPLRTFDAFLTLARKLDRAKLPVVAPAEERLTTWLRNCAAHRRNLEALREAVRRKAFVVLVPLIRNSAAPRMDEVLRLITGLKLAELLRKRGLDNVVTLGWPVLTPGDEVESGGSAIVQRSGEIEDVSFSGGDTKSYTEKLRANLPGTGFSAWLIDSLARAASEDADSFKARLLLRLFDDEGLAILPTDAVGEGALDFERPEKRMGQIGGLMSVIGVVREGAGPQLEGPLQPLNFPSISATMVEGKVEQWLQKFALSAEEVLAREAKPQVLAKKHLPRDLMGVFSRFKEGTLGALLRAELSLNELEFMPNTEIKRALDNFDLSCDKLRQRAQAEMQREEEINHKQLAKLFHYMLPVGQPQQNVISLLHYLDFYGPEFLKNLRAVLEADDLRHQVVYLAPTKGAAEE
jgi:Bacillithiol biosynthesis BshC